MFNTKTTNKLTRLLTFLLIFQIIGLFINISAINAQVISYNPPGIVATGPDEETILKENAQSLNVNVTNLYQDVKYRLMIQCPSGISSINRTNSLILIFTPKRNIGSYDFTFSNTRTGSTFNGTSFLSNLETNFKDPHFANFKVPGVESTLDRVNINNTNCLFFSDIGGNATKHYVRITTPDRSNKLQRETFYTVKIISPKCEVDIHSYFQTISPRFVDAPIFEENSSGNFGIDNEAQSYFIVNFTNWEFSNLFLSRIDNDQFTVHNYALDLISQTSGQSYAISIGDSLHNRLGSMHTNLNNKKVTFKQLNDIGNVKNNIEFSKKHQLDSGSYRIRLYDFNQGTILCEQDFLITTRQLNLEELEPLKNSEQELDGYLNEHPDLLDEINKLTEFNVNHDKQAREDTVISLKLDRLKLCDSYKDPLTGDALKLAECETCLSGGGFYTALGCIKTDVSGLINNFFTIGLGLAGGIALLFLIYGGFLVLTSQGNAEQIQKGREVITSAIAGLVLIIFSIFIFNLIANDILKIPFGEQNKTKNTCEPAGGNCLPLENDDVLFTCININMNPASNLSCASNDLTCCQQRIIPTPTPILPDSYTLGMILSSADGIDFPKGISPPLDLNQTLRFSIPNFTIGNWNTLVLVSNANEIITNCQEVTSTNQIIETKTPLIAGTRTLSLVTTYKNCSDLQGKEITTDLQKDFENKYITIQDIKTLIIFPVPLLNPSLIITRRHPPENQKLEKGNQAEFIINGPKERLILYYSIINDENIELSNYCQEIIWSSIGEASVLTPELNLDHGVYRIAIYPESDSQIQHCSQNGTVEPIITHEFEIE